MAPSWHATLNAFLNALSAGLLLAGRIRIARNDMQGHKRIMLMALTTSAMFLISYVIYHAQVGSVPYPHHDWTRILYFVNLIPHVILAALMVPFIIAAVTFALKNDFARHTKLTVWVWPVWMYVSVSGVIVYTMLYLT